MIPTRGHSIASHSVVVVVVDTADAVDDRMVVVAADTAAAADSQIGPVDGRHVAGIACTWSTIDEKRTKGRKNKRTKGRKKKDKKKHEKGNKGRKCKMAILWAPLVLSLHFLRLLSCSCVADRVLGAVFSFPADFAIHGCQQKLFPTSDDEGPRGTTCCNSMVTSHRHEVGTSW